ncbi:Sensor protein FixL [Phycisphaerae bacterium RAS1]|nr:Sensor protein FixL [Phycisphaerae bacterium RAS1]
MQSAAENNTGVWSVDADRGAAAARCRICALGFACTVVLLCGLALAGWLVDWNTLKRPLPNAPPLNPLTGVCLSLLAISLALKYKPDIGRARRRAADVLAILGFVIGIARLASCLAGFESEWGGLLCADDLATNPDGHARTSPNAALSVALSALVLMFIDFQSHRGVRPAQILAILLAMLGLLSLLSYAYDVPSLSGLADAVLMSPTATLSVMLLAAGALLARPDCGFIAPFLDPGIAGVLLRRLLPAVIVVPSVLGWLRLKGQWLGFYDVEFGTLLFVVSMVGVLAGAVAVTARVIDHLDELRRQAVADLCRSEERFALAVGGSSDGLWDWNLRTDDVWYAPRFKELIGYSEQEYSNRLETWTESLHPDDREPTLAALREHVDGGRAYDVIYRLRTKSGPYRWFRARGKAVRDLSGSVYRMAGSIQDITSIKEAQAALADKEAELRTILNSTADGIVAINARGIVTSFNAAAERMFGYRSAEVVGRNVSMLMPPPHRQHDGYLHLYYETRDPRMLNQERELEGARRDGTRFPLALRVREVLAGGERAQSDRAFVGVVQDISVRKALENSRAELLHAVQDTAAELARSNKDLEEFAYVASHDLRAPLRAIKNLAEWMAEDLAPHLGDENGQRMSLLLNRVMRLDRLIDDLLQYSRAGRVLGKVHTVDVDELVDEIIELGAATPGIEIVKTSPLPKLETASAPLQQVLRNLIGNAIKHHDGAVGRIEVSARRVGAFFEFTVSDDGPGIAPEFHQRVFGLFETLKPRDTVEGSGMGLAVVKRTVERFGGTVALESDGRRGSTFRFTWPAEIVEASPPAHHLRAEAAAAPVESLVGVT